MDRDMKTSLVFVFLGAVITACSASGDHRLGVVASVDAAVASPDGRPWDLGSTDAGSCQTAPIPADKAPLDMYLMVEKSFVNRPNGSGTWDELTRGIGSFVATNDVADVGLGIQYFPLVGGTAGAECVARCGASCDCLLRCGCGSCDCAGTGCVCASRWFASCDLGDYAKPAVEIATLPAASSNLMAWLFTPTNEEGPATTRPALQGAIQHAHDWAVAHPGRNTSVVLVLNGPPSQDVCRPNQIDDMLPVVAAGADGTPTVQTFVVASGSDLAAAFDPIAAAGGSGHVWNIGTDFSRDTRLPPVLAQIRDAAMACQYAVPKGPGAVPDYGAVGVELRFGPGPASRPPHVANRDGCAANAGGWYYDDPGRPSRIVLCDSTCAAVEESPRATVSTMLGCPQPPAPPR
jgi:hypothetical protein